MQHLIAVIFIIGAAAGIYRYLYRISRRYRKSFQKRIERIKSGCLNFKKKNKKIESANIQLDQNLLRLISLYEVTKDMGGALDFSDVFAILSGVIKRTFDFTNSKLILINEASKTSPIKRIYEIKKGAALPEEISPAEKRKVTVLEKELRERPAEIDIQNFDQRVIKLLLNEKRPILISPDRSSPPDIKIVLPEGVSSFIGVPLIVEDKILAILTLEGFKGEVFDNFLILAAQLPLEIKKIELYQKGQELAVMDGLTKLLVRRYFLERYTEEIERSKRHNLKLSFFMIDIDHFKSYNDMYGHLSGDIVLQETAEILKNSLRQVDLVGRYGGEEFVVVLPQTDKEDAVRVAERIRWAADNHIFRAYDKSTRVTISIGVATFPADARKAETLIEKADQALYTAKRKGRNRVEAYQSEKQKGKG